MPRMPPTWPLKPPRPQPHPRSAWRRGIGRRSSWRSSSPRYQGGREDVEIVAEARQSVHERIGALAALDGFQINLGKISLEGLTGEEMKRLRRYRDDTWQVKTRRKPCLRWRLKIFFPSGSAGSSPAVRTN